uniref:AnTat 1.1 n=1 Tax=Trypanosoma brucei TaxID=5691 RepID=O60945_9TRYP|nr:unnamed protein product [Trypanosoma brucei]
MQWPQGKRSILRGSLRSNSSRKVATSRSKAGEWQYVSLRRATETHSTLSPKNGQTNSSTTLTQKHTTNLPTKYQTGTERTWPDWSSRWKQ